MVFDRETARERDALQHCDRAAGVEFKDVFAAFAAEVMVVAPSGDLETGAFAGEMDRNHRALCLEAAQVAVDRRQPETGVVGAGRAQNLLRGKWAGSTF